MEAEPGLTEDKKTVQLPLDASELLDRVKEKTGCPKGKANAKAVRFWAPLVLANKLSIVEDGEADPRPVVEREERAS